MIDTTFRERPQLVPGLGPYLCLQVPDDGHYVTATAKSPAGVPGDRKYGDVMKCEHQRSGWHQRLFTS